MDKNYLPRYKVMRWPNSSPYLLQGYLAIMPDDNPRILYKPVEKTINCEWLTTQLTHEWHETAEQAVEWEVAIIKREQEEKFAAVLKQIEGLLAK